MRIEALMSRKALTLRGDRSVTIGDATVTISWARRGEVHLVVDAPPTVPIRVLPRPTPTSESK